MPALVLTMAVRSEMSSTSMSIMHATTLFDVNLRQEPRRSQLPRLQ
jgi:hypothetical protein